MKTNTQIWHRHTNSNRHFPSHPELKTFRKSSVVSRRKVDWLGDFSTWKMVSVPNHGRPAQCDSTANTQAEPSLCCGSALISQ